MLTEEFAEVVQILSGLVEKIQTVTDRQKEVSKKIETQIKETEMMIKQTRFIKS
jgi:phage shock protein A